MFIIKCAVGGKAGCTLTKLWFTLCISLLWQVNCSLVCINLIHSYSLAFCTYYGITDGRCVHALCCTVRVNVVCLLPVVWLRVKNQLFILQISSHASRANLSWLRKLNSARVNHSRNTMLYNERVNNAAYVMTVLGQRLGEIPLKGYGLMCSDCYSQSSALCHTTIRGGHL